MPEEPQEPLPVLERYPFTDEEIYKGRVIAEAELLQRFPDYRNLSEQRYDLKVLQLARTIEHLLVRRGEIAYVKCEHRGLRVLTDAEATVYVEKMQQRYRRALKHNFLVLSHVDYEALSPQERIAHERRLVVEGRYMQAQLEHERKTQLESARQPLSLVQREERQTG